MAQAPASATASRSRAVALTAAGAAIAAAASVSYAVWRARRRRHAAELAGAAPDGGIRVRVLYGSTTGTSERWAHHVAEQISRTDISSTSASSLTVQTENLATFSFDSLLTATTGIKDVVVILLSTHTDGVAPPHCAHFCTLLDDHVHDFRVSKHAFAHINFAVLGFGSAEYEPAGHYCTAAASVDAGFAALAAQRLSPMARITDTEDMEKQVHPWTAALANAIKNVALGQSVSPDAADALAEGYESDETSTTVESEEGQPAKEGSDVEELAESCGSKLLSKEPREMLTKKHRASLTKEGYKLIGSHSAVKLCRWTKHQLRGRGGCYKHSFYGITSYQCMEATPSLACANKCTFCWRHHKNPVGTEWRWSMDPPDMIVAEAVGQHKKMIREARGIPGVKKERFEEAMTVKHCALSLVGEPIMYPRINELVSELHKRQISTFLVTNAQFPEAIHSLSPVTQLYVSVDAGTKETLKAVDRPLFADFWERYLDSLRALREKKQRTVYRLTLVKDHNMADSADYARLVALGEPDFIEIKSVTFCGESKASNLSIGNTPWHEEVRNFAEAMLSAEGLSSNYELACEHQHSCIVLIAHKRYKIDGRWHTWIDYDAYQKLVSNGTEFSSMDYLAPTPDWAVYGSGEAGFDPAETRVYHNRTKRRAKDGLLSEAQLRHYPSDPAKA